jgi:hypothetical protein
MLSLARVSNVPCLAYQAGSTYLSWVGAVRLWPKSTEKHRCQIMSDVRCEMVSPCSRTIRTQGRNKSLNGVRERLTKKRTGLSSELEVSRTQVKFRCSWW